MSSLFIFGAKYLFILSLIIGAVYFLWQPRSVQIQMLKLSAVSLPLIYIASLLAGFLYYDPRPFVIGHFIPLIPHFADNGFPSDHALLVAAVAIIVTLFNKRVGVLLWVIAVLVAVSRVSVGVHHFIDVFASMIICVAITVPVFYWLNKKTAK